MRNSSGREGNAAQCWLCGREIGRRVEWHHLVPKSRGGRETVALHPICHRTIHANFTNAELARVGDHAALLKEHDGVARFLKWIENKPADFHAKTAGRRR